MKIKTSQFLFLASILFICVFQLTGCQTSNRATPTVQESWETISNRWSSVSLKKVERKAKHGELTAQYYLGRSYFFGNQIIQNQDEALGWITNAADKGLAAAQNGLGRMYEIGDDIPQDYTNAAKFYRLAADQGYAMAQNNLGRLYFLGLGVETNVDEALKWYQKSAEQGEHLAQKNLAWIYAQGAYGATNTFGQGSEAQIRSGGIAPDHQLAEKWMGQAVDLNSAEGQYEFANMLKDEVDDKGHQDTNSFHDAAEWFRKAAERDYAKAQYELAEMYNTGELGDDQRSNCITWFLKAAASGNAQAKAEVGELPELYPKSELLKSIDTIEALREGAESGNLDAQFQLAKRYAIGDGVPKDATEAFKWMQKAAQNNTQSSRVGDATYDLALMYEKGEGVTQDLLEAHNLFLEAGTNYFQSDATFRVGQMYEKGDGVPQDDHKAMEFYGGVFHNPDYPGYVYYVNLGNGSAESLLYLWAQGRGFPNNKDKAEHGYREPSDLINYWQGYIITAKAEFYVGQIYYQGKLVPQDLVEAAARFRVAANQNLDDARKMLGQIELEMLPAQKEAAKNRFDILEKRFELAKKTDEAIQKAELIAPW